MGQDLFVELGADEIGLQGELEDSGEDSHYGQRTIVFENVSQHSKL